jgi:hypothetical protein
MEPLTEEQREELRQQRLDEPGNEPPCPLCGRARVRRSDYIRCNPCGTNWLDGEALDRDPRLGREPYLSTRGTLSSRTGKSAGAQPAK